MDAITVAKKGLIKKWATVQ